MRTLTKGFDPATDIIPGAADGRVRIVWYVDYACPHTRRMRDIIRRSPERFGAQNASVALRFILPEQDDSGSELAARAAFAAQQQDRFWDMHDALFELPPHYTPMRVMRIAQKLGLDMTRFRADLESDAAGEKIAADRAALGDTRGLHMPMIFIDGRYYEGAWDEQSLVEAIEQPLGVRIALASTDFFHWAASAGLVLILATLAALLVANLGGHDWYEHLRETEFTLSFGAASFGLSLEHWSNDG